MRGERIGDSPFDPTAFRHGCDTQIPPYPEHEAVAPAINSAIARQPLPVSGLRRRDRAPFTFYISLTASEVRTQQKHPAGPILAHGPCSCDRKSLIGKELWLYRSCDSARLPAGSARLPTQHRPQRIVPTRIAPPAVADSSIRVRIFRFRPRTGHSLPGSDLRITDHHPVSVTHSSRKQHDLSEVIYGRPWQVETTFSMVKRDPGWALTARRRHALDREIHLRLITHNLMITRRPLHTLQQGRSGTFFARVLGKSCGLLRTDAEHSSLP